MGEAGGVACTACGELTWRPYDLNGEPLCEVCAPCDLNPVCPECARPCPCGRDLDLAVAQVKRTITRQINWTKGPMELDNLARTIACGLDDYGFPDP